MRCVSRGCTFGVTTASRCGGALRVLRLPVEAKGVDAPCVVGFTDNRALLLHVRLVEKIPGVDLRRTLQTTGSGMRVQNATRLLIGDRSGRWCAYDSSDDAGIENPLREASVAADTVSPAVKTGGACKTIAQILSPARVGPSRTWLSGRSRSEDGERLKVSATRPVSCERRRSSPDCRAIGIDNARFRSEWQGRPLDRCRALENRLR